MTISIVSHQQQALILPLLEQLDRLCTATAAKIVLTVNVPEPDLLGSRTWAIPIDIVTNPRPRGFGSNHNAAFSRCTTDWFLVLNPDVRLDTDILTPLLAQAAPDSGLLAPRILEPGKTSPEPHRGLLTPLEILRRKQPGYVPPSAPAWIPGLFMLFRSTAFHQVHGFDERFFMYGEDFDLCARTRLAGWRIQIAENLAALHDAQRDSHRSPKHLYWHTSSLLRLWCSGAFWRYWRLRNTRNPIGECGCP